MTNSLIDICINNGAKVSDISIKSIDNQLTYENGIFTNINIEPNEILISIPFKLCISFDWVLSIDPLKIIFEDNEDLLSYPDEVITIGLMYLRRIIDNNIDINHELASNILIQLEHVKLLPRDFNTTIYWSDEEVEMLRPCSVYHLTKLLKDRIVSDWECIHQPLSINYPDILGDITIDTYKWALSIIYSRAVGFERGDSGYIRIIPPVIDMANHNPDISESETFSYDITNDTINLINTVSRQPGDECYAYYGDYCNAKLAYSYGFVIPHRSYRAVDLWTNLSNSSYQAYNKHQILQSFQLTKEQTYDFKGTIRTNYVSPALLVTIRVIQIINEEEMTNVNNAFIGKLVSVRNELATYTALKGLITSRMKIENAESEKRALGERLLNDVNPNDREFIALVIKVEERELLQETLPLIDNWIDRLNRDGDSYNPPDYIQ